MSRIVAVSPHLADAVFSCGGALARHAAQGHDVVVLSVCTAGEGLASRREEDRRAVAALDLAGAVHAGLPVGAGDAELATAVLQAAFEQLLPDLVLSPLGIGAGPDGDAVATALDALGLEGRLRWVDLPGALVEPEAVDEVLTSGARRPVVVPIGDALDAKLDAGAAYASALPTTFGDEPAMREHVTDFATRCSILASADQPVELLLAPPR
ncbi:PIG-L deacetylase family protein [Conexibacter sp. SYSU D00693]|uniref:PIG-L deacetylase family protein n=1 Tax=Conexibacter sp. SYSU D00693 TaxID=2812560 RepID=UPI00196A2E8E|nr:PIG-L family deacetylase [Conexibacter sp. SYSU D00693]